jgi:hypothetical protein
VALRSTSLGLAPLALPRLRSGPRRLLHQTLLSYCLHHSPHSPAQ